LTGIGLALLTFATLSCAEREPDPREAIANAVGSAMDASADPCQDFYRYACGGWIDSTEIPGEDTRWARSFSEIDKRNRQVLREILEEQAWGDDPELAKLGDYFGSCMDESTIESLGTQPLTPLFDLIAEVDDAESLMAAAGQLQSYGINVPFSFRVFGDLNDPKTDILHLSQGGLGMNDRDDYLKTDEEGRQLIEDYRAHVARMLVLGGESEKEAQALSDAILEFETDLAEFSRSRTEMRDVDRWNNKVDIDGLKELAAALDWDAYLDGLGHADIVQINVIVPEFFEGLERLLNATPAETLQTYLRWQVLRRMASRLPQAFVDENFAFYNARLRGQKVIRPRLRRCIESTDRALGELLGRAFVERMFPGDSKQIALAMVQGIEGAFESGLPQLTWMDEVTQGRAVEKMEAIRNKIGYPDEWRDYSTLELSPAEYFGNTLAARRFEFERNAAKIGQPVDPNEWRMSPPQVNAYYNPQVNEIVFPAGILQDPFFHRDFPAAMNYGGIGMVMGHELTHGFDDRGRKFDPEGQLREWWEDSAVEKFDVQAQCVEELYNGYEVQPGLFLNGKLTLGENIADLGGIKEAYRAYRAHVQEHGADEPLLDAVTDDQLFFVAFAQTWCQKIRPEEEQRRVIEDSHAHARYRVVGPISNLPEFARSFSCDPGTPMNPVDKCQVW
jgi:predicted metalloendopeptidase